MEAIEKAAEELLELLETEMFPPEYRLSTLPIASMNAVRKDFQKLLYSDCVACCSAIFLGAVIESSSKTIDAREVDRLLTVIDNVHIPRLRRALAGSPLIDTFEKFESNWRKLAADLRSLVRALVSQGSQKKLATKLMSQFWAVSCRPIVDRKPSNLRELLKFFHRHKSQFDRML